MLNHKKKLSVILTEETSLSAIKQRKTNENQTPVGTTGKLPDSQIAKMVKNWIPGVIGSPGAMGSNGITGNTTYSGAYGTSMMITNGDNIQPTRYAQFDPKTNNMYTEWNEQPKDFEPYDEKNGHFDID
jgi:hypothetical protein